MGDMGDMIDPGNAGKPGDADGAGAVALRPAGRADALCLAVLGLQVFLDTYATAGIRATIAREAMQAFDAASIEARIVEAPGSFIVAEAAGHLVGFAEWSPHAPQPLLPETALAELRTLYVQRPFLRRGIGARLLARVEREARAAGADVLWLTAWMGNTNALAFYASRGYAAVGTTWHVFEDERHENRLHARRLDGRVG